MERLSPKIIILASVILIAIVVGSYAIGIGVIGGGKFSFESSSWHGFSGYFNNMLSPILAAIAAAIAFFSLTHQLKEARRESSLNEQIANYLNHLKLLQSMIEKRWKTISRVNQMDWEEEPFYSINRAYLKERQIKSKYLALEVLRLCRLFEDLVDGVQWYTHLHKDKVDLAKQNFPRNEWSHFSQSLIQEQDKKMRFCYEYCLWLLEEPSNIAEQYQKEILIYRQFYENLVSDGSLYEP
ncbi:hypothetical protein [Reinekea thalattae]|uniref:DUF4760 domain-containing protein n=1 Tax=Reinekea thalattae TaxID=2593301 RepID=A0A5C8Z924_9GAMM|nr:hypothetical protein [Reinekea thalattae]TXR53864.1 hypothetical protein FME95_04720 [Reinekea thalattae]